MLLGLILRENMKNNNVSVFGGSGFIGSRLCSRLARSNIKFRILDIQNSAIFPSLTDYVDVTNKELIFLNLHKESTIINLAAEHRDDIRPVSRYDAVNVQGAINICEAANKKGVNKIIFTSSVAIYGFPDSATGEDGAINHFNDYGRTKWQAEEVYKSWQSEDPENRSLVIIRPTVVFGEGNRGNVYNFLKQVASKKFVMVGDGLNRKSLAYVENVAAFLEYSLEFKSGVHIYNYIDKPDFTMNGLVGLVNNLLGRSSDIKFRIPFGIGFLIGSCFDIFSEITGKKFPISSIRIRKFCSNSVYESAVESSGFIPPVSLMEAIEKTVRYEFMEDNKIEHFFYSE